MAALAWPSPIGLPHSTILCAGDAGNDISSDMSSSETLSSIQLGLAPSFDIGAPRTSNSSTASNPSKQQQRQNRLQSIQFINAPKPADSSADPARGSCSQVSAAIVRKGQGYRKLWQVVSRVQKGERLSESRACREDVTVEDLVKIIQQLPASASAVEAIAAGLGYLDSRAAAALLKGLAKAGVGHRSVEIFDYLRDLPDDHDLRSLCDIFTYTTMISQCNSHQQLRRALELVAEMRSRAIPLNVHTYSALLNVCLKANELDLSLDVYAQMLAEGCTPNLVTYNTLLDIYNKAGRWVDALNVLELLQHQNIKPEARTYNAIMVACNTAGQYGEAVRVHKIMSAAGAEPNGATFNAALTAYARSGQLEAALQLFTVMGSRGYERGANTYAAVLFACEMPGRWDLALELLQQMQLEGLRPSTACLTSAISSCLHGGQPQRAEQLFERMYTVCKPDAATFNYLVQVYCQLGKHREAINVLEVILRGGQLVEAAAFDAAISACWGTGAVPLQQYALQLFDRARQQGLYQLQVAEQVCGDGSLLDIQLPPGSVHVVLLALLHALRELREQHIGLLTSSRVAKVLLRLLPKAQDAQSVTLHVTSQLRGWKSPFVALPQMSSMACLTSGLAEAGGELRFAADSLPLAEWLHGPVVTLAISRLAHSAAGLGLVQAAADGMMTGQEDAHKEVKCRQAVRSVAAYESKTCIKAQAIPPTLLLRRSELVQLLLSVAPCLGLSAEMAHDAVQLMDQAMAVGLPLEGMGHVLAAACLYISSQQDISALPLVASAFQSSTQQVIMAAAQVRQLLGGSGTAISAMRVLHLFLERLGVDPQDPAATFLACGQALAVMDRAALSPAFVGCPPSVVASAVLQACRLAAGLLPSWPSTLAALTGYREGDEVLQPFFTAAVQLL